MRPSTAPDARATRRRGSALHSTAIRDEVRKVIVGQDEVVEQLLITLLVGGHCLITGMPGTAKTLLVRTLASALGLSFKRIQFTPDLMPTDITGTDILEEDAATGRRTWTFVPGPLFAQRAAGRRDQPHAAQDAVRAARGHAGTLGDRARQHATASPPPFFVLATQNPIELEGTYPLPEAQLDRFLFNVVLDYLNADDELEVVQRQHLARRPAADQGLHHCRGDPEVPVAGAPGAGVGEIAPLGRGAGARHAAQRSARRRRCESAYAQFGASVRATQFLALAAKARALSLGRYHVTEDDVRALALPVLRHRVLTNYHAESDGETVDDVLRRC